MPKDHKCIVRSRNGKKIQIPLFSKCVVGITNPELREASARALRDSVLLFRLTEMRIMLFM
jgi:hypothetical protein